MSFGGRAREVWETVYGLHRRQPLVAGALLFVGGIACGYRAGVWQAAAGGAVVCAAACAWVRQAWARRGLLAALALLAGWGVAARDADGRRREAAWFAERRPRQVYLCRVGPEVRVTPQRGNAARFSFRAEAFRSEEGSVAFRRLPVTVQWYGARAAEGVDAPRPGEVWRLAGSGRVRRGRNGLPELTVSTGQERSGRVAEADPGAWQARVARARRQAVRRVTLGIEEWGAVPALNMAMLLGARDEMPQAMRRVFADSGTIHVFAISGLHIAFVAGLLVMGVRLAGVPRTHWVVAVAPLLVFYTVTTGARPSAVRACVMAVLFLSAPLFGRRPSGVAALAGTALAVHAVRPWLVFDVGNMLSFVVMGGLVAFCGPFCAGMHGVCGLGRLETRARLLAAAGRGTRAGGVRLLGGVARVFADSFAVSLAAWLASVPLTAYYFGRFTPGGLLANVIVAPCAFMIVTAGFLGMAASFVSGWLASCFNHAAGLFTTVMVWTAETAAAMPGGNFRVPRWAPWMVWAWFAALALLAVLLRLKRREDGMAWCRESGQ